MRLSTHAVLLACYALFAVTSCSTAFEVTGPQSDRLSTSDVQQIKLLVAQRSDIKQPILRILVDRPDRAVIDSGRQSYVGDVINHFTIRKQHGRWVIASSIKEERIVVTAH